MKPLDPTTLKPGQIVYTSLDVGVDFWKPDEEVDTSAYIIRCADKLYYLPCDTQGGAEVYGRAAKVTIFHVENEKLYANQEDAIRASIASEEDCLRRGEEILVSARAWLEARAKR